MRTFHLKHHLRLIIGTALLPLALHASADIFNIQLETFWQNLEGKRTNSEKFGGQWILVGGITLKKKANDAVTLDTLRLKWQGPNVTTLHASLYKKEINRPFRAIEDNLVCDGLWRPQEQSLIFNFDEQHHVSAVNIFYLVLTVPTQLEPILKTGHFELEKMCLPIQFQEHAGTKALTLSCSPCKPSQSVH